MKKTITNPYVLLTLTVLFWSGNMVVGRGLREAVPPMTLAFWRWAIAFMLTLPFALPHLRRQWPLLKANWPAVVALGLIGIGGYNTFAYISLQYTTATSAALLNSFTPIATIALAFLFLGKRLGRLEAAGIVLSFVGVMMIVSQGSLSTLFGLSLNRGDLWMLLAVLTWGIYTVGLQWRPAGVHPMLLLAAFTLVGLMPLIPAYLWEIAGGRTVAVTPASVAGILYTGVFPGFLGYVFYNAAVAAVGPSRGAQFLHLMPVFATILAVIFLGERPFWYHFAGIVLVFAGIALATRRPGR